MPSNWQIERNKARQRNHGNCDPFVECERVTLGFFYAVLAPAVVCLPAFVTARADAISLADIGMLPIGTLFLSLFIAFCITGPAALVFGVPVFFLFRKRGWVSWWAYAAGGWAIGLIYSVSFGLLTGERIDQYFEFGLNSAELAMPSVCGCLSALIFWGVRANQAAVAWASFAGMFVFLVFWFLANGF